MTIKRGPKIGIIGDLLAPHFNEASANAISLPFVSGAERHKKVGNAV